MIHKIDRNFSKYKIYFLLREFYFLRPLLHIKVIFYWHVLPLGPLQTLQIKWSSYLYSSWNPSDNTRATESYQKVVKEDKQYRQSQTFQS